MSVRDAEKLLGLSAPYTSADVKSAAASALRAAHPDSGGAGDAATQIAAIKKARAAAMANADTGGDAEYVACPRCNGTGTRPDGAYGRKTCIACGGDGVVKRRTA